MPNMSNITVKNNAATDVVFTAAAPSSGDRNPAVWRNNTPAVMGHRPKFQFSTRNNAAGTGRIFEATFDGPIVETVNGTTVVVARTPLRASGTLPTNVAAAKVLDNYVLFSNLLVSALVRQAIEEGYAPT